MEKLDTPNSSNPCILIVDDDEWILEMAKTVLDHSGYQVVTAADGEAGLDKAKNCTPRLIILDVMMPKLNGWMMIKQLRTLPEFAFVPVIFLSALNSSNAKIKGFQLGADDYWAKPFDFNELPARVSRVLKRGEELESTVRTLVHTRRPQDKADLSGRLEHIGIPSLLLLFETERKTGVLLIKKIRDEETGRIFLRHGCILQVRLEKNSKIKNQEALYHLLGWSEGEFVFTSGQIDIEDEIDTPTMYILLEGARRVDETTTEQRKLT